MYTTIAVNIYVIYLQINWRQIHVIMTFLLEIITWYFHWILESENPFFGNLESIKGLRKFL